MISRVLRIAVALGVLAPWAVASAADRPAVIVTRGSQQSLRVALQRFAGGPGASEYQSALGDALEYSSVFQIIDSEAFLGSTTTRSLDSRGQMVCSDWSQIGADVFIEGVLEISGAEWVAEFRVWDVASCERELRRRYRQASTSDPVVLAKRMADDVVEEFTGVKGIASTELAFVSKHDGTSEIYVMDADGSNQRAATANRSINNFPSWSPTGDAIAYTSYRHDNRPLLFLSSRGQGKPGLILPKRSELPQYRAVFGPGNGELAVVMSPEGSTELYRVRTNGKEMRRLTQNRSIDVSPAWSPDGRKLAFVSDRSGSPQIYLMNSDGSSPRRLTFNGDYNTNPAWSPDGEWIAYQARVGAQFDIWLIDPEGSVNLPLVTHPRQDESPSWSPDSRKLAFSSTRRGSADIYVVDVNGENLRRLTRHTDDRTSPSWGPYPR